MYHSQTTFPITHCPDSSSLIAFTCVSSPVSHHPVSLSLFIPCSLIHTLQSFVCCCTAFPSVFPGFLSLGFGYLALFPGLLSCLWSLDYSLASGPCMFCLFLCLFVLTACLCMTLACTLDYASGLPHTIKLCLDLNPRLGADRNTQRGFSKRI